MRQFVIEEPAKEWIFDLDGNVYHPSIRDSIERGMVVGLRVAEREIPTNERIEFIDKFKNYNRIRKKYEVFLKSEQERKEEIKKEVKKIIIEVEAQSEQLLLEKEKIEKAKKSKR